MPTATLTFTLPEDREEHLCAMWGRQMASALGEIRAKIRAREKYGDKTAQSAEDLILTIRDLVAEAMLWEEA